MALAEVAVELRDGESPASVAGGAEQALVDWPRSYRLQMKGESLWPRLAGLSLVTEEAVGSTSRLPTAG